MVVTRSMSYSPKHLTFLEESTFARGVLGCTLGFSVESL